MRKLDADGQPSQGFHHNRLIGRSADELIGICKGVIADGELAASEALFLLRWMEANSMYVDEWPFNVLYRRLAAACEDGIISDDEHRELLSLLLDMVGPGLTKDGGPPPCEVLCDSEPAELVFVDRSFCITGKFAAGPRRVIEEIIVSRGGKVSDGVSRKTHVLLLGGVGSRDWLYSTHGTKLQAAAQLRENGHLIEVIAERHFLKLANVAV